MTTDRLAPRIRAATLAAIVSGIFTAAVAVALLANDRRIRFADPLDSPALAGRKEALRANPRDEALKGAIRRIDRDLRAEYVRRQTFAARGAYLLLLGLASAIAAARLAVAWRAPAPIPKPIPGFLERRMGDAGRARWSVGILGLALATGAGIWAVAWTSGCYVETVDVAAGGADPKAGKVAAPVPPKDLGPPTRQELRKHWPRFRGPDGLGISAYPNAPTSWNGATGENILWKASVPLPGENSPIVWGDRVFLTGADEEAREVYAFDAASGALVWTRKVETPSSRPPTPVEPLDATGFAAPTAATDGRFVCAIFANGDIACFDLDGRQVWARNLGAPLENPYGHGASLLLHGDLLIVPYDQGSEDAGLSRLYALNVRTGETVWEAKRPVSSSWSTPIVIEAAGGLQLLTAADPFAIAYEPESGAEIWRASVLKGDVASSPIFGGGLAFTVSADSELCAIDPTGKGDVTTSHVRWKAEDGLPDITSPLTDGERVWLLPTDGYLVCYDARSGKKLYEQEIDARFHGSPTLVGDKLYLLDTKGTMHIISAGPAYAEIGKAELGEKSDCSPAFLDGRIYIRGKSHLYAIGGGKS